MSKGERKVNQDKQEHVDEKVTDDLFETSEDNKPTIDPVVQPITNPEVQPRKPKDWEPPKTENEDATKPELG